MDWEKLNDLLEKLERQQAQQEQGQQHQQHPSTQQGGHQQAQDQQKTQPQGQQQQGGPKHCQQQQSQPKGSKLPSELELRQAFRKASLKHHPDKGGKSQNFIQIKKCKDKIQEELDKGRSHTRHDDIELMSAIKKLFNEAGMAQPTDYTEKAAADAQEKAEGAAAKASSKPVPTASSTPAPAATASSTPTQKPTANPTAAATALPTKDELKQIFRQAILKAHTDKGGTAKDTINVMGNRQIVLDEIDRRPEDKNDYRTNMALKAWEDLKQAAAPTPGSTASSTAAPTESSTAAPRTTSSPLTDLTAATKIQAATRGRQARKGTSNSADITSTTARTTIVTPSATNTSKKNAPAPSMAG